jgi:hypothetical protein
MLSKDQSRSKLYRLFFSVEEWTKRRIFGCQNCGQCVVRSTGLTCPMTCPKQLRNGPCGGSMHGKCEVDPSMDCVWTTAYERSERFGWLDKLDRVQPAVDWSLWGSSAILNIFEKKITRQGEVLSPHPVPTERPIQLLVHKS